MVKICYKIDSTVLFPFNYSYKNKSMEVSLIWITMTIYKSNWKEYMWDFKLDLADMNKYTSCCIVILHNKITDILIAGRDTQCFK